ncbi:MAG TPA: hypothetical protein VIQ27_02245 [Gemmatimonadales bacterium]
MGLARMPLSPRPWEQGDAESRDLARLLDAMWRRRWRLAAHYPWVPVTPARVYSQFHGGFGPYPAGAVVRLWTYSPFLRGTCPRCGGDVLGFAFGGNLSRGHISGICLRCAAWLRRQVDGIGDYMSAIRPALQDSAFSVNGGPRVGTTAPVALVAVLGELGETALPDPRGPELWPDYLRAMERG